MAAAEEAAEHAAQAQGGGGGLALRLVAQHPAPPARPLDSASSCARKSEVP